MMIIKYLKLIDYNLLLLLFIILSILLLYSFFRDNRTDVEKLENCLSTDYLNDKKIDPLNMKNYWYPILFSNLIKDKPYSFKLLDEPLVLYRDKNGKIICAQDICPHRSAKLSLGNVKNGNLECQYHGWQFGEDGQCYKIPSVQKESMMKNIICLNIKPTIEDFGIIFVWPGNKLLADKSLVPEFIFRERKWKLWDFFEDIVDLPFGHELMVDNLLDAVHIDFTHDGTIGKRKDASYTKYEEIKENIYSKLNIHSFSYNCNKPYIKKQQKINFTFIPPCFVKISIEIKKNKFLYQTHAIIPTEKDKMRLLISFHQNFIPTFITKYFIKTKIGKYFLIKQSRKVINQDLKMLIGIKENIKKNAKSYYKITNSDIMIKRYREEYYNKAIIKDPWFKGYDIRDIEDL